MERELTLEELELETAEYLPPRLVMSCCNPCYNPCDTIRVNVCLSVRLCL